MSVSGSTFLSSALSNTGLFDAFVECHRVYRQELVQAHPGMNAEGLLAASLSKIGILDAHVLLGLLQEQSFDFLLLQGSDIDFLAVWLAGRLNKPVRVRQGQLSQIPEISRLRRRLSERLPDAENVQWDESATGDLNSEKSTGLAIWLPNNPSVNEMAAIAQTAMVCSQLFVYPGLSLALQKKLNTDENFAQRWRLLNVQGAQVQEFLHLEQAYTAAPMNPSHPMIKGFAIFERKDEYDSQQD